MPAPVFYATSLRWNLFNAIAEALEGAPELQGVPVKRNPTSAITVKKGDYLVVVRWNVDTLLSMAGFKEQRQFSMTVGSIANTASAGRDADALHMVVGEVARQAMPGLNRMASKVKHTERDVSPDLENQLIEGELVLSTWEIEYEKPAPAYPGLPRVN
jgi:hypothetical protein